MSVKTADRPIFEVVTPGDLDAALVKIDAQVSALDLAVKECPSDPMLENQWKAWRDGYARFSAANKGRSFFSFGLVSLYNQALQYGDEADAWSDQIASMCRSYLPVVRPDTGLAQLGWKGIVGGALVFAGLGALGYYYVRKAL